MEQLAFSFVIDRCPHLRPDQALLLWELVEAIAAALWDLYEDPIVEHILAQNRAAAAPHP